ncbi:MAG: MoaD/ThiS family protein [Saprospiraceae bacterium]|nr:MoaD/ThiS family protein [Saprospiraceae bacterium]
MTVKIVTFGIVRDMLGGQSALTESLPSDTRLEDLSALLNDRYPALRRLDALRYAVNARYAGKDVTLQHNDEIALIPPVSGG